MADHTPPLTAEVLAWLSAVGTATLTTCLLKRGFRNTFLRDVHPVLALDERMIGLAYTLRMIPSREDIDSMANYGRDDNIHRRSVEECPPGHVLIIDARGDTDAAVGGDVFAARLQIRGAAGMVTDGGFRDTQSIIPLKFPVYHRRAAVPSTPIKHRAVELNGPIACGGVAVYPGDVVFGDHDGVVIIPAHVCHDVAKEANETTQYEAFVDEKIREGRSIFGLFPATEKNREEFEAWRKRR